MRDSLNGIYVINVMKSNKMKMMMEQNNICIKNNKAVCFKSYFQFQRLLFALKNQLEQEVKLQSLATIEIESLDRSTANATKKSKEISSHIDRFQGAKYI